jgi:hypothetical protein
LRRLSLRQLRLEEKDIEETKVKEIEGWKADFDKKYP